MAKSSAILDWCIIRLGEDHNWWVDEVSDPVRWDVDGLSIIDPRQIAHLIELVEPLRDYGFESEMLESAFIPFRIEKEAAGKKVRLKRVKDSFFESEEKLFGLPDILDEENGPYADLLDHLTRCRVKMLNDLFDFESKLTVDEVEDEIREAQNASFIEGHSLHVFTELTAILDFMPAGYETEDGEEAPRKQEADLDDEDLPELDESEEEQLKNDNTLNWDDDKDKEDKDEDDPAAAKSKDDDDENLDDLDDDDKSDDDDDDDGEKKSSAKKSSPASGRRPPPRRR